MAPTPVWTRQAKHCPLCGAALADAVVEGRARRRCTACRFVLYQNPACASAAVVLDEARRVLLVRRAIEPYKGAWALPAGYQELEEEPHRTAVREVLEESGIEVRVLRLLDLLFVGDDPRKPANVAVYLCRAVGGALRGGDDSDAAQWFALDALPDRIGFENNRRILARLRELDERSLTYLCRADDFHDLG